MPVFYSLLISGELPDLYSEYWRHLWNYNTGNSFFHMTVTDQKHNKAIVGQDSNSEQWPEVQCLKAWTSQPQIWTADSSPRSTLTRRKMRTVLLACSWPQTPRSCLSRKRPPAPGTTSLTAAASTRLKDLHESASFVRDASSPWRSTRASARWTSMWRRNCPCPSHPYPHFQPSQHWRPELQKWTGKRLHYTYLFLWTVPKYQPQIQVEQS